MRGLSPFERHLAWFGTARAEEAMALLSPELRAAASASAPLAHVRHLESVLGDMQMAAAGRARAGITAYQLLDFETYLSGDLLTKVDRCTMAHGVESRAPFRAARWIQFALALPDDAKLRGTSGKWALKQAAKALLPADLLARRKQGFSPPFSAWARGPLRGIVLDELSTARIERAGVLDARAVQQVVREHLDGREDRGRTLWTLLSLQCWAERWVASAPAPEPVLEGVRAQLNRARTRQAFADGRHTSASRRLDAAGAERPHRDEARERHERDARPRMVGEGADRADEQCRRPTPRP